MSDRWLRQQERRRLERVEEFQSKKVAERDQKENRVALNYPRDFYYVNFVADDMRSRTGPNVERLEVLRDRRTGEIYEPQSGSRLVPYGRGDSDRDLRSELNEAKKKLVEQNELLQRLASGAAPLADVIQVNGATTFIAVGGSVLAAITPTPAVAPGDQVKLVGETMQIKEKVEVPCALGEVTTVSAVYPDGYCEIKHGGTSRLVVGRSGLETGDRVVLDKTGQVVTRRLTAAAAPAVDKVVPWDSIGGLEAAKRELRAAIELPYLHRDVFARYGQAPAKGVLLYGPPGCGKTLLGRAVASSLAALHGETDGGFIYVKGPELLDRYVGASEENVRALFEKARIHKAKHGYPAVIFLDEAESILGVRGGGSFMDRTIVPQFLAEMDGISESSAFVLLATNRPDSLDPAAVRDGRIDRRIHVGRPDQTTAETILNMYLQGKPTVCGREALARDAARCLFADELAIFTVELESGASRSFTLGNVVSGAMLAGVVQRATQRAIDREIAGDDGGIAISDIVETVAQVYREQRDIDHRDDMEAFLETAGEKARRITKGASLHATAN